MWTHPVTDRELSDILNRTPKGFCNAFDLNRIEGNCNVLAGWFGVNIIVKSWERTDFPTVSEFARIRDNIEALREAYYAYPATPDTPDNPLNTWQKFNDAERILYDLHDLYVRNLSAFYYAGEIYAGENIGVM